MVACSRPLSVVPAKSGDRPRIEIMLARPFRRWVARPGTRDRLSAMLASGSLPMSSAEIASMMLSEFCLAFSEFSMLPRMPVTMMASRLLTVSSDFLFFFSAALAFLSTGAVCVSAGLDAGSCACWADAVPARVRPSRAVAQATASGR